MKFSFILAFVSFFIFSISYGQVITILDKKSDDPLEFVTITSDSPKAITITDKYGQADISSFVESNSIKFQLLGYKSISLSFEDLESNHFIVYLLSSNISLDQVIISATKWRQKNKEIPTHIAVISPKDISFQNPQTAADLLNLSGEVYIQKSQQGGGSPMIRGFATNRVLISVDGIRMNNAIFRSGNIQNVISLDPFTIENTEVLFGPGSIIYGSDAIGGTMNFYTLQPNFSLDSKTNISSNSTIRYSSANNENTVHTDFNLGWKNFAMISSFSYSKFGDLLMGSNGPKDYLRDFFVKRVDSEDKQLLNKNERLQIPTNYSQFNMMQKFRYSPNEFWYIDYGFHYSRSSNYDRYDRLTRVNEDNKPRSAEWYYGPQIWMMNNFGITNLKSNSFYDDLAIRIGHQSFEESRHDRDFMDPVLNERFENVNALSLNIDLNKRIDPVSKYSYGAEMVYNNVNSKGNSFNIINKIKDDAPSRYPNSDWMSFAGFFIYQRHLNKDIYLQSGLRYNYIYLTSNFDTTYYPLPFSNSKISNGALTGSLGFVYTPINSWTIGINLSTGFRAPNVDDIGKIFDSEPGAVVVPNPDLNVEYAYNTEITTSKIFGDILKIDFALYYTYLDNAMVRRDFQLNGLDSIMYDGQLSKVQAIQNASHAYVWGLQTGFELDISNYLTLSGRFSYQKGEEELDDGSKSPLRHSAPYFGNSSLSYEEDRLRFDLYMIFNGEISHAKLAESEKSKEYLYALDGNGNVYSPFWYTLNFKLSYSFSESYSVNAGIENITDQRYRQYSSGIASAGRNFIISGNIKF